jgi:ATP-dependent Clp protease adaptor protein ClpS
MVKEKSNPEQGNESQLDYGNQLILYNDEVNTFEYVIEVLVDVCEHELHQAETCAYLAHYRGKCTVKSGTFDDLKPKYDEMTQRGLTMEIQ